LDACAGMTHASDLDRNFHLTMKKL